MKKDFYIHVFCITPLICELINKSFHNSNFIFDCTNLNDIKNGELENLDISPDCIVIDKGIKREMQDKIKLKYKNLDIIYLPSLYESDSEYANGCKQISEPLKLSELGNVLEEIYNKKKGE